MKDWHWNTQVEDKIVPHVNREILNKSKPFLEFETLYGNKAVPMRGQLDFMINLLQLKERF